MFATSSGLHTLPSGTVPSTFFLPSGVSIPPRTRGSLQVLELVSEAPKRSTYMAVSPTAGLMQLYLILSTAYSAARPFVACASPSVFHFISFRV